MLTLYLRKMTVPLSKYLLRVGPGLSAFYIISFHPQEAPSRDNCKAHTSTDCSLSSSADCVPKLGENLLEDHRTFQTVQAHIMRPQYDEY